MKKICNKCHKDKLVSDFYFSKRYEQPCKQCRLKQRRTINGVLYQRWRGIVQRNRGEVEHFTTSIGKGHLSKKDFFNWCKNNKQFLKLYKKWKENNFNRKFAPSIDRKDVSKGYFFGNIQWITMEENMKKAQNDHVIAFGKNFTRCKKVRLWKETGSEMIFESGKKASIYFGKNRLAVAKDIENEHKFQGWNCEYIKEEVF